MADKPVPPVKAGWRTSEFWLSLATILFGALFASGVVDEVDESSIGMRAILAAVTVLGALGYTVVRSGVKKNP